jgi:hypothetical protein
MHTDHIDPDGEDVLENLCLACANCNQSKYIATDAPDPMSREVVPLFNPRTQQWHDHFEWIDNGLRVHGLTAIGRATIERLKMNHDRIVLARESWISIGLHPPRPTP